MALQTFSNLESLLSIRTKINANFTELYATVAALAALVGTGWVTWSGLTVLQTSPTLITPTLWVARATSVTMWSGWSFVSYNTVDETTNLERLVWSWSSNIYSFNTNCLGSGTGRALRLSATSSAGTNVAFIQVHRQSSPYIQVWLSGADPTGAGQVIFNVMGGLAWTSGVLYGMSITNTVNQSSTAWYAALFVNPTETATWSGTKALILAQVWGSARLIVTNTLASLIWVGTEIPTHSITLASTATGIALYNTVDQVTNYERIRMQWVSNVFYITGGRWWATSTRNIRIWVNSSWDTDGGNSYINYWPDSITYNIRSWSWASQWHFFTVWANTSSSWTHTLVSITESVAQSGTGAYTWLLVNITETSTWSGAKNLILTQIWGVTKFAVDRDGVIKIWNTVTVAVAVASTHKVSIDIWGTVYQLLAIT